MKLVNKYLSLKKENGEIYTEKVPVNEPMDAVLAAAKTRLAQIRKLMPAADLTMTLEAEFKTAHGFREYKVVDVETGKIVVSE